MIQINKTAKKQLFGVIMNNIVTELESVIVCLSHDISSVVFMKNQ